MTAKELKDFTKDLVDTQGEITGHLKHRPRRAAKDLCQEFRALLLRGDFWDQLGKTGQNLQEFRGPASEMLGNMKQLVIAEAKILARLGIKPTETGIIMDDIFDALPDGGAANADITPAGIRNLHRRLSSATDLICEASRGPILRTIDFVTSKKGAATIGALALGGANVWFAITADGGALSHVSMKVAVAAAHGHLSGIIQLLG
jgi:hypothetical protein